MSTATTMPSAAFFGNSTASSDALQLLVDSLLRILNDLPVSVFPALANAERVLRLECLESTFASTYLRDEMPTIPMAPPCDEFEVELASGLYCQPGPG